MNVFQKTGVFLCRLTGLIMLAGAILGFLYAGYLYLVHRSDLVPPQTFAGSFWWLIFGVLLVLLATPIGKALGRGLT